jgi:hypothetical protein
MSEQSYRRPGGSIAGAVILIALGVVLLIANLRSGFDPWPVLVRYWPLILILLGIGGIVDYFQARAHPGGPPTRTSGAMIALIVLVLIFGLLVWRHHRRPGEVRWEFGGDESMMHSDRTVDLAGATSVRTHINMPAGQLNISSGAGPLLDAHFDYTAADGDPQVNYNVAGGSGQLEINQTQPAIHVGRADNEWRLRFANNVPLDLSLDMGAGQGHLDLNGLDLTNLKINLGAGQMDVDLRGARTTDLDADIEGGVGQGTIRLPQDVGVRVHAEGGIGSINVHGLRREGDEYVNDALGKSPATIHLRVEGGVGSIDLDAGP